jgi:hypothetical protein
MEAKKRRARRQRIHERGSRTVYTVLSPKAMGIIDRLLVSERRTLSMMVSVLVEEALKARGLL